MRLQDAAIGLGARTDTSSAACRTPRCSKSARSALRRDRDCRGGFTVRPSTSAALCYGATGFRGQLGNGSNIGNSSGKARRSRRRGHGGLAGGIPGHPTGGWRGASERTARQLGTGTIPASGSAADEIAGAHPARGSRHNHSLAVGYDGGTYGWGDDASGALGVADRAAFGMPSGRARSCRRNSLRAGTDSASRSSGDAVATWRRWRARDAAQLVQPESGWRTARRRPVAKPAGSRMFRIASGSVRVASRTSNASMRSPEVGTYAR